MQNQTVRIRVIASLDIQNAQSVESDQSAPMSESTVSDVVAQLSECRYLHLGGGEVNRG